MSSGRAWNHNELLLTLNLYCRIPFGSMRHGNPTIKALAAKINRTPSAVAMKLGNFASLDPSLKKRNVGGLPNTSRADRRIWEEFHGNWEALAFQSQDRFSRLIRESPKLPRAEQPTERLATRRQRLVQGFFREAVLSSYENKCAMCSLDLQDLLIAGHIIPWSKDVARRADPRNGLLLCSLHDKAFEHGHLSVSPDYKILVSQKVIRPRVSLMHKVGLLDMQGRHLNLPLRFAPAPDALEYHRSRIFEKAG